MDKFLACAVTVLAGLSTGILIGVVSLYAFVYLGFLVGMTSLVILLSLVGGLVAAVMGD